MQLLRQGRRQPRQNIGTKTDPTPPQERNLTAAQQLIDRRVDEFHEAAVGARRGNAVTEGREVSSPLPAISLAGRGFWLGYFNASTLMPMVTAPSRAPLSRATVRLVWEIFLPPSSSTASMNTAMALTG